jgi:hypothetical protein
MRKDKKENPPPASKAQQFLDTVFGPDEEITDELADEILASHNMNSAELLEGFKLRLHAELRRDFQETGQVSRSLEGALQSIRKQQQASKPSPVKADSWIDSFLRGAISSATETHILFSFHKQKEGKVSAGDKVILDELESELGKE